MPDGEAPIDVVYAAKGEQPVPPSTVPPVGQPTVQSGNDAAAGRVQPAVPNAEPVAGAELQAPAHVVAAPGGPTLKLDPEADPAAVADVAPEMLPHLVPADVAPEDQATVEVLDPNGLVESGFQARVGYVPEGPIGSATISEDGVWIGGDAVPMMQVSAPPRIEHHDCADEYQTITLSFLVKGINYASPQFPDNTAVPVDGPPVPIEEVPHHEVDGCTCQLSGQHATNVAMFNQVRNQLRRFVLQRDRDDTGVSGTGVVAEGVLLTDGRVVLRWLGDRSSIVMWNDLRNVLAVHGHDGATRLRWLDTQTETRLVQPAAKA